MPPIRPNHLPMTPILSADGSYPVSILWAAAVVIGVSWGGSQLLSKLAVSTGHDPAGIAFVSTIIAVLVLSAICVTRRSPLPMSKRAIVFYIACGIFGTALPSTVLYTIIAHLPVGIVSILIAGVPMLTLLLGWLLGREQLSVPKVTGIVMGGGAAVLIAAPDTALPGAGMTIWVLLGLVIALSYAIENMVIDITAPAGADAITLMTGMSWAALALLLPVVWARGGWIDMTPMGTAEQSIIGVSLIHLFCYTGFVWLIGKAGPVFAAQIGYVVTVAGVFWGMAILGERHSAMVWLALALMLAGMALVQPRRECERREEGG